VVTPLSISDQRLLLQHLVADRLVGDPALEALRFLIVDVRLAALEMRFAARQKRLTPRRQCI